MLKGFMHRYATWDPMMLWDGRRWHLYLLAMERSGSTEANTFFCRENHIHGFESEDLRHWREVGPILRATGPHERLCAGTPILIDGRYYFFVSVTVEQLDARHLDQRLMLACSEDGVDYKVETKFELDPDSDLYPHRRFHPQSGRMLFAWRDPYPFRDPRTGRYHLFICTGGQRWGCAPGVAVASARQVAGPYQLHDAAVHMPVVPESPCGAPLCEIERVQVHHVGRMYYLTFSCWKHLVNESWFRERYPRLPKLTNSSVYIMEAKELEGPYYFGPTTPVVAHSGSRGYYGTSFLKDAGGRDFAVGWRWADLTVDVTGKTRVYWKSAGELGSARLGMSRSAATRAVECLGLHRWWKRT